MDIVTYPVPDVVISDELLRCSHSGMSQPLQEVKHQALPAVWHHWIGVSEGSVT